MLKNTPRFGRSHQFIDVFGSPAEQIGYFSGLVFAGVFVLAVYLLWIVLLLVFGCLSEDKTGFLSGYPFQLKAVRNAKSESVDRAITEKEQLIRQFERHPKVGFGNLPFRVRFLYLTCGVLFTIFSILLVTQVSVEIGSTLFEKVD
jgi:hypothetical protein